MIPYDYDAYDGNDFEGSVLDFISEFKVTEKDGEIILEKYNGASKDVIIPNGITVIGEKAFYEIELNSVVTPDSLKFIENYAFSNCGDIESFKLSKNIMKFGHSVFENTNIENINIPDSIIDCNDEFVLEKLTANKNYTYNSQSGFYVNESKMALIHNSAVKFKSSFAIPDGIRFIGSDFFSSCENIQMVTLPDSIEYIGSRAFAHCSNLRSINFPKSLKYLGNSAFFETEIENLNLSKCKKLKVIPNYCFTNNKIAKEVKLPSSIERIGDDTFFGCNNLSQVNFEDCKELRFIDKTAFQSCDLKKIDLSENSKLFVICNSAFSGNRNLTDLELPENLRFMASNAFAHTGLQNVIVSSNTKVSNEVGTGNDKEIYVS